MITKRPRNNEGYYDLIVTDKNGKSFFITVGGNLDLYWIPENHKETRTFEIDKNDTITFSVFEQLYAAIKKVDDKYAPVLNEDTITFISEDWPKYEANTLKIIKSSNTIKIQFIENTNHDAWSLPHRGCNICFCNSGSRVPKVESLFMKMFNYLAYQTDLIKCESIKSNKQ